MNANVSWLLLVGDVYWNVNCIVYNTKSHKQKKPADHYEHTPIKKILQILQPKRENFQKKHFDIFHISTQNIDCGYLLEPPRRGGSNGYLQSMF